MVSKLVLNTSHNFNTQGGRPGRCAGLRFLIGLEIIKTHLGAVIFFSGTHIMEGDTAQKNVYSGDTSLTFLMRGTIRVRGHRTYLLDDDNNGGGDTAQH